MADGEYDNVINYLTQRNRRTQLDAMESLDANPDDAARAQKLSTMTGIDPGLVYSDLDNVEKQTKSNLVSGLIEGNPHLQEYLKRSTLAAKISNDDWGKLDIVSQAMDKLDPPTLRSKLLGVADPSVLGAFMKSFAAGHGYEFGIPQEELDKVKPGTFLSMLLSHPTVHQLVSAGSEGTRLMSGALTGVAGAGQQLYYNLTGDEAGALDFARDLMIIPQVAIPELAELAPAHVAKMIKDVYKAAEIARWHAEAGERPSPYVHPIVHELAKFEAKSRMKDFDDLYKKAQATETLPRSQEAFEDFVKSKFGDAKFFVSAEKALELYPEGEVPMTGDGRLGGVPNIATQLEGARLGRDVVVPWSELGKISPESMDVIHDGVRISSMDLTLDDAKVPLPKLPKEEPKGPIGTPLPSEVGEQVGVEKPEPPPTLLDTVRRGAGLEPPPAEARPRIKPQFNEHSVIPESAKPEKFTSTGMEKTSLASFSLKEGLAKIKTEGLNEFQQALHEFFGDKLSKLVGDVRVHVLEDVPFNILGDKAMAGQGGGRRFGGWYDPHQHQIVMRLRTVSGAMGHDFSAGMLLHEGAHALTSRLIHSDMSIHAVFDRMREEIQNFLKDDPDLAKKYEYALSNPHEVVAAGYERPDFRNLLANMPVSPELAKAIGLKDFRGSMWDAFRQKVSDILYWLFDKRMDDTMLDAFLKMQEHVEVGLGVEEERGEVMRAFGAEMPEELPDYLRNAFEHGKSLGMRGEVLDGYLKLIKKQHDEGLEFDRDHQLYLAGLKNKAEWKLNWPRVNAEAKADILRRPDISADRFLRTRRLPNDQVGPAYKIDPTMVDPELLKKLDPEWFAKGGVHPDRLAEIFGYQSGEQLIKGLADLADARETAGQTPAGHLRSLVDGETQRRMEKAYGKSAEDLLKEAEERVVTPTTFDILHHEYRSIYESNGQTPMTEAQIKAKAIDIFDRLSNDTHSSKKYLAEMGREANRVQDALATGDGTAAMLAKEHQVMLAYQARLAVRLEQRLKQYNNRSPIWTRRAPPGRLPEAVLWLHDIMFKILDPPDRSRGDWEINRDHIAQDANLKAFVERVNQERDIYNQDPNNTAILNPLLVPDYLFKDEAFKSVDQMTPIEFYQVFDALKMIDKYALDEGKAVIQDRKENLREVVSGFAQSLREAVAGIPAKDRTLSRIGRVVGSMVFNPETWFLRLDLGKVTGRWGQTFTRPMMEGLYLKEKYGRDFAKLWRQIGDFGPLHDVENPNLFMDPLTNFATPMQLDTHDVWSILANMGNELQRIKLAKGYGIDDPQKIWDWLHNVRKITKEDVQRAQRMGDVFSKAFELSELVYAELYGVTPERIELGEIQTPWGPMKEWYHPLIPDPKRAGAMGKAVDMLGESGFWRPSPAHGYTIKRQGGSYAVQLGFGSVPFRLQQILNDAAMRTPIHNIGKLVFNSEFKNNFIHYMGKEYYDGLVKWMKDSAGNRDWIPANQQAVADALAGLQQNMNTGLIGWNLGTVLKHGPTALMFTMKDVGVRRYASAALKMAYELPGGQDAWEFTKANSDEIPTRIRWAADSVSAADKEIFKVYEHSLKEKFLTWRDMIQLIGSAPVAISDLLSSGPMWYAEYTRRMEEPGMDHGTAKYLADTAVRRTHGSVIIGARSQILRTNPFVSAMLPFYNFFNNALQRNYEMLWKSKLAMQGRELSAMTGHEKVVFEKGMKHLPEILGSLLVYGIGVSLWEQMIDPLPTDELEDPTDYALYGAKVLSRGPLTMLPGMRDIINGLWTGHDPSAGIYGTVGRNIYNALKEDTWTGEDHEKTFRRANAAIWTMTGLSYDEVGKVGQFYWNVNSGREDGPQDASEFYKMIRRGTLKSHPKEVEDFPTRALKGFAE